MGQPMYQNYKGKVHSQEIMSINAVSCSTCPVMCPRLIKFRTPDYGPLLQLSALQLKDRRRMPCPVVAEFDAESGRKASPGPPTGSAGCRRGGSCEWRLRRNRGVPGVSDISGHASAGIISGGLQTLGDTWGFRDSMNVVGQLHAKAC